MKSAKKLVARRNILYNGRMYKPGEELPTNNAEMAEAWTSTKTAVWMTDTATAEVTEDTATEDTATEDTATAEAETEAAEAAAEEAEAAGAKKSRAKKESKE